jgi:hypothetical protein
MTSIKMGRDIKAEAIIIADEQGREVTTVPVIDVLPRGFEHNLRWRFPIILGSPKPS